jgi:UDPglucose 6-dehydrogenase
MPVADRSAPRVCVVGLGKLGSPMAAVFAAKGFEVIGLDVNRAYVDALNAGCAPVDEPRLQELIDAAGARLTATTSYDEAIAGSDVSFVIVPTPSGADAFFINDYVVEAVRRIGSVLRHASHDHLVVITSTVMPGATGSVIRQALEESSGRIVGTSVGLCYSPEFIALGSVVRDLLNPDMVLIGECTPEYGDRLAAIYHASTESAPAVHRMGFVNAEICKIAVNTYVTTKISYANMLADLCEHLPDANVDVITAALGADTRIGPKYLRGGVAYGGPCFPRDNKAFAALARTLGVPCSLAEATDQINDYQVHRLAGAVHATCHDGARVAILGLSYKPDTGVYEQSQGLALARLLLQEGYRVTVADPLAAANAARELPGAEVASFEDAVRTADAAVVTTPWPALKTLAPALFVRPSGAIPVIDPWGILRETPIARTANLILLGRRPAELAHAAAALPEFVRTRR